MNHHFGPAVPAQETAEAAALPALEARIRSLDTELARVRAEFASFSSRISHDMQGIFRNIDGFACALQGRAAGKLTDQEARYVERILAGARRGDSLMRDLASLSAAAVAPIRPYSIDPAGMVDQCIRDLSATLAGRDVEWDLADGPWPRVMADPGLLRLAVDHVLGNAVKFTRGRVPARIRITVAASPQEWVFAVADNGAGFDAAYAGRLFHVFERLHLPAEFEGNGVGLAVVRTVAERHGGRVGAAAPPEGGAVFTIGLPQAAGDDAAQRCEAAGDAAEGRLRILVVDDDPMVLTTVQLMLEREGHEVVTAAGGAAALQALGRTVQESGRFDLVVCDWLMPEVGGAEVARAAKALDSSLRVIVLTGQRPDIHGRHALPAAVDHVLAKPVTPAQLRRAVALSTGRPDPAN